MATMADAAPPNPFSNATICGIAVIFTASASQAPARVPMTKPSRTHRNEMICWSSRVAAIASNMPSAPIALPRRAVRGDDNSFSPTMNSTAATRYVSEIRSAIARVGSALVWNAYTGDTLLIAPARGSPEHPQHTVGHEEAADDVDRGQRDR